ncbi:hypothetical protein [Cohnella abietis]|uniref:DUF4328 domain-containing protein n=1 Tax=Cohnella abietis TaxID=2507935 RepID=A0A3T1CYX0_9BACL|nr:hypothetical protein [Cohnella abietis]BBI31036.1 hypothetical protein KCTCHS21_04350 [Cohnella abietis]
MPLKSEMLSKILTILLWILTAFSVLSLLTTIVYVSDLDLYITYVYSLDGFIEVFSYPFYFIVVIVYLIWIYRVHMDLNTLFSYYPRTPGGSLVCMLLPIYNFYGIPSTFNILGEHLKRIPAAQKQGLSIKGLAAPLIIFFLGGRWLKQLVNNHPDVDSTVLVLTFAVDVILNIVYLVICMRVAKGLTNIQNIKDNHQTPPPELEKPTDWISTTLENDFGADQKS